MSELGISEGETINIELNSVPTGSYIKIRPHKTEFINLSNPKAILENILVKITLYFQKEQQLVYGMIL